MIVPIKFPINARVFDSKVRAKIDNAGTGGEERFREFGSEPVRQREKYNAGLARDLRRIGIRKFERGRRLMMNEARESFRNCFAGELPGRGRDKIDIWMREEQAHQFLAGVTGSAHHCHFHFSHNAQCVFRLTPIATKSCGKLSVALRAA